MLRGKLGTGSPLLTSHYHCRVALDCFSLTRFGLGITAILLCACTECIQVNLSTTGEQPTLTHPPHTHHTPPLPPPPLSVSFTSSLLRRVLPPLVYMRLVSESLLHPYSRPPSPLHSSPLRTLSLFLVYFLLAHNLPLSLPRRVCQGCGCKCAHYGVLLLLHTASTNYNCPCTSRLPS